MTCTISPTAMIGQSGENARGTHSLENSRVQNRQKIQVASERQGVLDFMGTPPKPRGRSFPVTFGRRTRRSCLGTLAPFNPEPCCSIGDLLISERDKERMIAADLFTFNSREARGSR